MYRLTRKAESYRLKLAAMRASRAAATMTEQDRGSAPELPNLRRRIVIEDFDFGHRVHVLELYRTDRIDCYRAVADGVEWKRRIGWSNVLAGLRKSFIRVGTS